MFLRSSRRLQTVQSNENQRIEARDEDQAIEFPFFELLPEHIKANILFFCDFETMMNATATCKYLENLVFSFVKLTKRIKLSRGSIDEVMKNWEASKRNHKNLQLVESQRFNLSENLQIMPQEVPEHSDALIQSWVEIFAVKGSMIRELTVGIEKFDIVKFLVHCKNLEKLRLEMTFDFAINPDRRLQLPKLRVLEMIKTRNSNITIFSEVRSLEYFSISETVLPPGLGRNEAAARLENFILQQDNLKTLNIKFFLKRGLFTESRLNEVNFKLNHFKYHFWGEKPKIFNKFLQTQSSSLRILEIVDLQYFNISILRSLETLKLSRKVDWNAQFIEGKLNSSVKNLTLGFKVDYTSEELENIFKVLPNVQKILVESRCKTVLTMSPEKLKVLKFKDGFGLSGHLMFSSFIYQPVGPSNDLSEDSENIFTFINQHFSIDNIEITIKCPTVLGRKLPNWFQEKVLRILPNLKFLQVSVVPIDTHHLTSRQSFRRRNVKINAAKRTKRTL